MTAARRSVFVAVAVVVAVVVAGASGGGAAPPSDVNLLPQGTKVETYRDGLSFPVDVAWVRGTKKLFFTEKNTGRVRVMVGRRLLARACADLDVSSSGERGALGIALHPRFSSKPWLYVYYTNRSPLENRVTRFTVRENRCRDARHIVNGLDASSSGYHNGGQLEFVGGHLYVATGEAHDPAAAQDLAGRLGKVLRYSPSGAIPDGNPFSTDADPNPVWSYGHRNPFGLAAGPKGRLYESENGPQCDDEVNLIRRGRNYGWGPSYECGGSGSGTNPVRPLIAWTPPIVPTDLHFYRGRLRSLSGDLYMGDFAQGRLHRLVLADDGTTIRRDRIVYRAPEGIVDVTKGPGGWLYFVTPSGIARIITTS